MNNFTFNRAGIAVVLLVVVPVLGGCGSGSSEDSTVAPQASSAQTPIPATAPSKGKPRSQDAARRGKKGKSSRGADKNGSTESKGGKTGTGDPQSQRSPSEKVVKSLRKLVGGGGGGGEEVVASSKKVRKILEEAMEGSHGQGSAQHRARSIDRVAEEVFSGR
jgi:hypothetical protein